MKTKLMTHPYPFLQQSHRAMAAACFLLGLSLPNLSFAIQTTCPIENSPNQLTFVMGESDPRVELIENDPETGVVKRTVLLSADIVGGYPMEFRKCKKKKTYSAKSYIVEAQCGKVPGTNFSMLFANIIYDRQNLVAGFTSTALNMNGDTAELEYNGVGCVEVNNLDVSEPL